MLRWTGWSSSFTAFALVACDRAFFPRPRALPRGGTVVPVENFAKIGVAALFLYGPHLWCHWRKEDPGSYGLRWTWSRGASRDLTLALLVTLIPLTFLALHWPGQTLPRHPDLGTVWRWALSGGTAAIIEETFYRGWIQSLLRRRLSPHCAVALTSLVFAASHLILFPYPIFLATFFPGLVMGWLRERHGSIAPGTLYHGLGNLWAIWFFPSPF